MEVLSDRMEDAKTCGRRLVVLSLTGKMTHNHTDPRSSRVVSLAPTSRFPLNVLLFFLSAESEKKTDSWIVWLCIGLIFTVLILVILFLCFFLWKR